MNKKAVAATAAALGIALLFYAQGGRAAALANDYGSGYQNPWGPSNPQSQPNSGFAPWVFDFYNPRTYAYPNPDPLPGVFFIDSTKGAWGINVAPDLATNTPGYDAAWVTFTGNGNLDPGRLSGRPCFLLLGAL